MKETNFEIAGYQGADTSVESGPPGICLDALRRL